MQHYRVSRVTALTWEPRDEQHERDIDEFAARAARLIAVKLRQLYPDQNADVRACRVGESLMGGTPQLLFEITVPADSPSDAKRRALYKFERALKVDVPRRGMRPARLVPPWGEATVEPV